MKGEEKVYIFEDTQNEGVNLSYDVRLHFDHTQALQPF